MKIFAYAKSVDAIRPYIHQLGGSLDFSTPDLNGGVMVAISNSGPFGHSILSQDADIVTLPFNSSDVLPDGVVTYLSKHEQFGIQKGDTFGTALEKIRVAYNGDPRWLMS